MRWCLVRSPNSLLVSCATEPTTNAPEQIGRWYYHRFICSEAENFPTSLPSRPSSTQLSLTPSSSIRSSQICALSLLRYSRNCLPYASTFFLIFRVYRATSVRTHATSMRARAKLRFSPLVRHLAVPAVALRYCFNTYSLPSATLL